MFYKPNFCCECGEKVERIEWGILTSRKFCEVCEGNFTKQEASVKLGIVSLIGLVMLFIFNSLINQKSEAIESKTIKPVAVRDFEKKETTKNTNVSSKTKDFIENPAPSLEKPKKAVSSPTVKPTEVTELKPSTAVSATEKTYFCGALTKKGSPCSRKVKTSGRCWQHLGEKALLPPEKLVASQ